jgi:hypothetical protein
MSETISTGEVTAVSGVGGAALGAAVGAAALLSAGLLVGLGAAALAVLSRVVSGLIHSTTSAREIRPARDASRVGRELAERARALGTQLPPVERRKVEALAAVAPFVVSPAEVTPHVRRLVQAGTPAQAGAAARALHKAAVASHNRVLLRSLEAACRAASVRAGFATVHATSTYNTLRLVAEDGVGRALVTEIELRAGAPVLRAEVVGVADGTCHAIAENYLRALAQTGVRCAEPPIRRPTGGVPTLEASRDYVRSTACTSTPSQRRQGRPARVPQRG